MNGGHIATHLYDFMACRVTILASLYGDKPWCFTVREFISDRSKYSKALSGPVMAGSDTNSFSRYTLQLLRWSRGSVLAFSTQVRGFKPGRNLRIFKGQKILSTPSFGGEVKPSVPCRRFAACKRSLNGVEVVFSAKLPDNILAHSSTFCC